jgi:aspartate/methionine/tyrosine aminotransferase
MIPLAERIASLTDVSLPDESAVEHHVGPSMLGSVEKSLLEGETHYTVRPGIPELRRQIAAEIERKGGPAPDAEHPEDNVLITSRDSESLFVILLGLEVAAGDAIVSSRDHFPHAALFRLMGLEIHRQTRLTNNTRLTYRRWTESSKHHDLLALAGEADLPDILDLGPDLWNESLKPFPPAEKDRTLIMGNLNAFRGMVTFPIAYVSGPRAHMARYRRWKQALSICSAAPSQRAALYGLAAFRERDC